MFELLVEIEPFGPAIEMGTGIGRAVIVVSAGLVHIGAGKLRLGALTQLVEDRAGPPVKMGINDVHGSVSFPVSQASA